MIDQPSEVRPGSELDTIALEAYLTSALSYDVNIESVKQFPGGYSNLTYLIKTQNEELVLRRPPVGANIKSAHDMSREYRVLRALENTFPKIPQPKLLSEDTSVIGSPFYLMERVEGLILRNKLPEGLNFTTKDWHELSESTVDQLAELHLIDIQKTRLVDLGKPEGYVARQVNGWIKRYQQAQTDSIASMNFLAEWLPNNQPSSYPIAFIHNDYKYDNLVLNPKNFSDILAILDWEMATVGDPFMDLGTSLGYWAEPNDPEPLRLFGLTSQPGNFNRQEVWDYYCQKTGFTSQEAVFYFAFASFKIAAIAQQIYARYHQGLTNDPRFGQLIQVVQSCGENGRQSIQLNKISGLY